MRRIRGVLVFCAALLAALPSLASGSTYTIPLDVDRTVFSSIGSDMQALVRCGSMSVPLFGGARLDAADAGSVIALRAGSDSPEMDEFARCLSDASTAGIAVDYVFSPTVSQSEFVSKNEAGMPASPGRAVSASLAVDGLSVDLQTTPLPKGGLLFSTRYRFRGRLIVATASATPACTLLTAPR